MRPINLPAHLFPHSLAIIGLGLYMTIFRTPPTFGTSKEFFAPRPTRKRTADTLSLLGIVSTALMLPYYLNSYMPIEENQWLYVSVPIRLFISTAMGATLLVRRRKGMSQEGFWEFVGLAVFDGAGALYLGSQLGRFDGIAPGYDGLVRA